MKALFLKIFIFFGLTSSLPAIGQSISNLSFEAIGKTVQISYELSGEMDDLYEVKVYISQSDGGWEGPLQFVSGDVDRNVNPGQNKQIIWDVLKEKENLTGNLKVKLEITTQGRCSPFTVTHSAGSVAPVTKTVTYGVVETDLSGSKKCWITQNLGADREALSATDASEESAGWYWQFNRMQGYSHDGKTRIPSSTWISDVNENSDWILGNDPCSLLLGSGWRLPSKSEWENSNNNGNWGSYSETFASVINLHAAGYLYSRDGSLSCRGSYGDYWSRSQHSSIGGRLLGFGSGYSSMYLINKAFGISARCIRDL